MSQFELAQIGGPHGSPVTVRQPVQDQSALQTISATGEALESVFSAFREDPKAKVEASVDKFHSQLNTIATAVESGKDRSWGMTQVRTLMNKTIANNPSSAKEVYQAANSFLGGATGRVVAEGSAKELALEKEWNDAVEAKYANPDMDRSSPEGQKALSEFRSQQAFFKSLEDKSKVIAFQQADVNLSESQRRRQEEMNQSELESTLFQSAVELYTPFKNQIMDLAKKYPNPGDFGQLQDELAFLKTNVTADVQKMTMGRLSQEKINQLTKPYMDLIDTMASTKDITEFSTNLQNQIDIKTRQAKLAALNVRGVPEMNASVGLLGSEMLRYSNDGVIIAGDLLKQIMPKGVGDIANEGRPSTMVKEEAQATSGFFDPRSTTYLTTPEKEGYNATLKAFRDSMKIKNGKVSAAIGQRVLEDSQLGEALTNMVSGTAVYMQADPSLSKYGAVMKFYASDEFGEYVKKNNFQFDRRTLGTISANISNSLDNELIPELNKAMSKAIRSDIVQKRLAGEFSLENLTSMLTNGKIEERVGKDGSFFYEGSGGMEGIAAQINHQLGNVINTTLRAGANLNGVDVQEALDSAKETLNLKRTTIIDVDTVLGDTIDEFYKGEEQRKLKDRIFKAIRGAAPPDVVGSTPPEQEPRGLTKDDADRIKELGKTDPRAAQEELSRITGMSIEDMQDLNRLALSNG